MLVDAKVREGNDEPSCCLSVLSLAAAVIPEMPS